MKNQLSPGRWEQMGYLVQKQTCMRIKMVFIYRWAVKTTSWPQDVTGLQHAPDRRLGCVPVHVLGHVLDETCRRGT